MTRIPRRRCSAVAIALAALLVTATPASGAAQKIVPIGPDPAWGCIQGAKTSLTVRTARGTLVSPGFRQAHRRLTRQLRTLDRRMRTASRRARERMFVLRRGLAGTRAGVRLCRGDRLPPPAAIRRTFTFACLHGFALPTVFVRGSCAVDLRPRGVPDKRARASAYSLSKTYATLDGLLHAECTEEDGTYEGPQRMEDIYGLYLVRCGPVESEPELPVSDAWDILRMDVENCDEILAADENGCGPTEPRPTPNPSPTPRPGPPNPQDDCIVLRMETENPDC
ncbi:MAG TPA: hypothetical protein VGW10_18625 [Solirubrobacteraceae bacterium]|nr:hypothetical protein [Solirubrobacteraceae bacterium]